MDTIMRFSRTYFETNLYIVFQLSISKLIVSNTYVLNFTKLFSWISELLTFTYRQKIWILKLILNFVCYKLCTVMSVPPFVGTLSYIHNSEITQTTLMWGNRIYIQILFLNYYSLWLWITPFGYFKHYWSLKLVILSARKFREEVSQILFARHWISR